jgi:predicted flap endonuclease-1-like 5' DNA nuclease
MEKSSGSFENILIAWAIAGLAAIVAFAMLMLLGGWTFMQAAFVGALVFMIGGAFMTWAFCSPLPAPGEVKAPTVSAPTVSSPAVARAATAAAPVAPSAAPEPQAAPAAAPEAKAETVATPQPAVAEPVAPAEATAAPRMLDAPEGTADDLKLIKGVGPKLEEKLNTMGVWHFSQIAAWTPEQVAWVDDSLNFRGRIERDDWIGQAKILASGGTTEFAQRSGKK